MDYKGTIIEESLANQEVLDDIAILSTKVERVVEKHQTPWLTRWTLHQVEIPEAQAEDVARKLSQGLESEHNWYADYKNEKWHYIIFRGKVFKIDRLSADQYLEARKYGIAQGIPEYQVDFSPDIK